MVTNKRIKTTESLQKRFFNGSKNLVIEIEKLMVHQSAACLLYTSKGLYKSFDDKTVLSDINATFENGKTNLIIGQSGSCLLYTSRCV